MLIRNQISKALVTVPSVSVSTEKLQSGFWKECKSLLHGNTAAWGIKHNVLTQV